MGWTSWFAPRGSPDEVRPSLRDVTFKTNGLRITARTSASIEWKDADGNRLAARLDRAAPERPLTAWTLDGVRSACRRAAAEGGGGIVSVTFERAGAIPIAKAVRKFPDGMGHRYEGTVLIRFREAQYSVTLQASEGRATGAREAMALALLVPLGEIKIPVVKAPAVSAPLEGWMRDPYDESYDGTAVHTLSDDERLDDLLPDHPLSRVRRWLDSIQQTLTVAADLQDDLVETVDVQSPSSELRHRMPADALGILFFQAGKPDVAERHLTEGIPLRDGEPVLEAPRLGDILILLGVTREALGRLEEAAWAHGWAVLAFAANRGDDDPSTVRARANLARVYALLGRHEEAEPLLSAAIPVFETTDNTSELAVAVNALGLVRHSQTRHAEAIVCFERALRLFEKLHGRDYVECATVLQNIARAAEASGDRMGSARALARADGIRRRQT